MPFPNSELRIPIEYKDRIDAYTRSRPTGGERHDPEDAPFPRQLDLWFLGVCVGAVKQQRVTLPASRYHKFNTAAMLENDTDKIEILELIAIAVTGDPFVIGEPRQVIDIANELAAGGLPEVFQMIEDGNSRAIDNLSDRVQTMLREVLPPPEPEAAEA
jgi:hypothetical protein